MTCTNDRTFEKKQEFLNRLSEIANVSRTCVDLDLPRRTAYEWRENDLVFAEAWVKALEFGLDALEDEAKRRAFEGVDRPVFYEGKKCGLVKEYSDTLAIFLLKAYRPDKFKDRQVIDHNVNYAEELDSAFERLNSER